MTTPPVEAIDRRLSKLRATVEQTAQNLVELEAGVTYQMLKSSSSLTGVSAERWGAATRLVSDLWQGQLALDDLMTSLTAARGSRASIPRALRDHLSAKIEGASVALPRPGADPAHRSLTEGLVPTADYDVNEALARMSTDYDSVVTLLGAVEAVWAQVPARLSALTSELADLQAAVTSDESRRPNEIAQARRAIADAEGRVHSDPLGFRTEDVTAIAAMVQRARASVDDERETCRRLEADVASVANAVDELGAALAQTRAQRRREEAKILVDDAMWRALDCTDEALAGLRADLEAARRLAAVNPGRARGSATSLVERAGTLRASVDAIAVPNGSGVATRNELRGRLGAYRAKARAMGRAEDLGLEALYGRARDVLFAAPCDLAAAEGLVAAYQGAVRAASTEVA